MDKKWSGIQPAIILEFSRKYIFVEHLRKQFLKHTGALESKNMADIGCGTGVLTRYLAEGRGKDFNITGIDLDDSFIDYARKQIKGKAGYEGVHFLQGDAYSLPFEDNSMDAVTDHTLLINIKNPTAFIQEELRVLKKGGTLSTITFLSDYRPPARLIQKPEYEHLITMQHKLQNLLKEHVFDNEAIGADDLKIYRIVELYRELGVTDIQVNGVFPIFSPDDSRYVELRKDWIKTQYEIQRWEIERFILEYESFKEFGLKYEDLTLALKLLEERYQYEQNHTTWIFSNNLELIISGKK